MFCGKCNNPSVAVNDTAAPSRPSGLSASATSSSQINLSWTASTDNVGVTGYKIYRAGTYVAASTGTSYTNTGLTASTSYSYQVSAIDAAGNESSQSSSASATTQAVAATPPSSAATSLWNDSFTPAIVAAADTAAVELGVKFQSATGGFINGLRFYKGSGNTGTHTGSLWTATGQLLATVTFANETASGWQYQAFSAPVAIAANTTYVASYHTNVGRYSVNSNYFAGSGYTNSPLRTLGDGENGGNGVYLYGTGGFPNQTYNASNYWVDVVFTPNTSPSTNVVSTSIWGDTITPAIPAANDTAAVELGVKFQSEAGGFINGLRFYKGPGNTGTHTGSLWTATGQLLATVTFANETASGWQYQAFSAPVAITANTTYVASYHTNVGRYSVNSNYFSGSGYYQFASADLGRW